MLTSLADRPASVGRHAAELVLPFAEMEAAGKGADAAVRALHVLTWLGVGGQYAAYQGRPDVTASAFRDRQASFTLHDRSMSRAVCTAVRAASLHKLCHNRYANCKHSCVGKQGWPTHGCLC